VGTGRGCGKKQKNNKKGKKGVGLAAPERASLYIQSPNVCPVTQGC